MVDARTNENEPHLIKEGKVNLSDCLACSGCVTTAEAILLESHSHEELNRVVSEKSPNQIVIISLSRQSAAVLAAHWRIAVDDLTYSLRLFLRPRGIDYVLTSDIAEQLYHQEALKELDIKTMKLKERQSDPCPPPGLVLSPTIQLIGSQCPGWICYAEKMAVDEVLENMSAVPPIQQWQGLLAKTLHLKLHNALEVHTVNWINYSRAVVGKGRTQTAQAKRVYHVTVEPCYDKKLESLRPEFRLNGEPLCDLVLGTNQFVDFLTHIDPTWQPVTRPTQQDRNPNRNAIKSIFFNTLYGGGSEVCDVSSVTDVLGDGSMLDSGGYVAAAAMAFTGGLPEIRRGLNADHKFCKKGHDLEYHIFSGLRNMSNLTRTLSNQKHFGRVRVFESLACPKGCLNGGCHAPFYMRFESPLRFDDAFNTLKSNYRGPAIPQDLLNAICSFIDAGLTVEDDESLTWSTDERIRGFSWLGEGIGGILHEKFRLCYRSVSISTSKYKW